MDHIHNEAVLAFLRAHHDNPRVKNFFRESDRAIAAINKKLGTSYKSYLEYLEANPGDDACYSMDELKALLRPRFIVRLDADDPKEFLYQELVIGIDDLLKPAYIKDEGSFFTVWSKEERIDIPLRFLNGFRKFLRENGVEFEDEFDGRTFGNGRD